MNRRDQILNFWFGDLNPEEAVPPERTKLWFGGSSDVDDLIRIKFSEDVEAGSRGEYDAWCETSRGALALIILLDQFSRNIFRHTPEAFANDAKALSICQAGMMTGQDQDLLVVERAFFYLPLEHSEALDIQKRSVASFRKLLDDASPVQTEMCESYYDYAVRHYEVIARFGRFPHRNKILGRASTPEEVAFLKQPGSSF